MSGRPGIMVTVRRKAPSGVSPNAYVGELIAEVRCHWTPTTPWVSVETALRDAYEQALAAASGKYHGDLIGK